MVEAVRPLAPEARTAAAYARAAAICDEDVELNRTIGEHGLGILRAMAAGRPGRPLNVLTHCNAGWLATVDYGTALAPLYLAHDAGIQIGRAQVCTPVTNAHLVCRLLLEKK